MEILNMNSQQTKPQEMMIKMSNGQFYDGTVRTVKQRAHKFNAIAISNINAANSSSNIPIPSKLAGSNNASSMTKVNNKNSENARKNVLLASANGHHNTSSSPPATTATATMDSNNNHNIKINIVNKYTAHKNTTHVTTKNINTEHEKINGNQIAEATATTTKSDNSASNVTAATNNINNSNSVNNNINSNTNKILLNSNDVKIKINQLNQSNVASVPPTKPKAPAPPIASQQKQHQQQAASWNTNGWIRIYCGPDRSEISIEDPNRMVMVYANSTTSEVVKDMGLPSDYTLWVQIGEKSRRLDDQEHPFQVQEEFLKKLGYHDESRRSRLGIDLDLKYLIRFHIGPIDIPLCRGATKCGNIGLLKGLVFPQWRRRTIAIIGTKLIVYPANQSLMPETYELSGSEIFEHTPVYNRLIIKIVPKISDSLNNTMENLTRNKSAECLNAVDGSSGSSPSGSNLSQHNNSNLSVSSQSSEVVIFLGFEESWERDLWSNWLLEATTEICEPRRMDISGSGLHIIPEVILQSSHLVEELLADHNRLQECALKALIEFKKLRVVRVSANHFKKFPEQLMDIQNLSVLDISKNEIDRLPDNIFKMEKLEELRIEHNLLNSLPNTLKLLRNLKSLQVANNRISKLPDFMIAMRFNNGVDYSLQNQLDVKSGGGAGAGSKGGDEVSRIDYSNPPLKKLNLRANHLKGNIILGNFTYLTQLDMSENCIEFLDLSALDKLESVQCCKNQIKELTLNGRVLNSLVASNNNLCRLIVKPLPKSIRHIDVSHNHLTEIPEWLNCCTQLRTLYANNNNISTLPDNLFLNENGMLHTIQLACNRLARLPSMPRRPLPLQELYVNGNQIEDLPEFFFTACENLILLNVSSNKLLTLPIIDGARSQLERLYATNNCLTDRLLDTLVHLTSLRILHLAFNRLTAFPESCISNWPELEELNISGNKLQHLPDNLSSLRSLRVLRVHSNQLQSTPALSKIASLRVLDLAHNQLDKINLNVLVSKKLQFLDLSCNNQLQVDAKQLQSCRSQRPMSLVDVSGKNRPSLPTTPQPSGEHQEIDPPWKVGFSETNGNSNKLYIAQLRLPGFCNAEGLFGMFDGEVNNTIPNTLVKVTPKILLEERTVKETASEYMKYTLLSAHRELKQQGQKFGITGTICHISRTKVSPESNNYNHQSNGRRFILRVASVGEGIAILIRQNGVLKLTKGNCHTKIGSSYSFPHVLPDPECTEVILGDHDEYLVIANKKLWEVLTPFDVASEIRKEENVLLAAKRLQDVAQSFGAEENLSIVVVRFNNLGTDIDFLMRELRHTIRKKPNGSVISGFCKCGCCCEASNCCHSNNGQFTRQPSARSDRSSPSGQSDQASISDNQSQATKSKDGGNVSTIGSAASKSILSSMMDKKSIRNGIARAVRARIEEERENESDSQMSEEQFKCWEYMLEQNTQLLFDKELNTISKAFTKRNQSNLNRKHVRSLSTSTPIIHNQLDGKANFGHFSSILNAPPTHSNSSLNLSTLHQPVDLQTQNAFLSKHFGSARSFQPHTQNLFKPIRLTPTGAPAARSLAHPMAGGLHAAYFGSLQRLMPYNLEYDFGMIQERPGLEEVEAIPDAESRMQQYWGVATTEL